MFKVLVVDDTSSVIIFMSRLLKNKFDCQVLTADNGLEALSILEDEEVDMIFLDVTMPVMDGIETLQIIRKSESLKNIPVVILSAVADKNVVAKLNGLKIHSYILKPLTYETTYKTIRNIFDKILSERKNANSFESIIDEEGDNRKKIVIIDRDEYFKEKFRIKLSERFIIFDSDSGAKGLNIIIKEMPDYIFISDQLKTLSASFIAKKAKGFIPKEASVENSLNDSEFEKPQIYLVREADSDIINEEDILTATEEDKTLFDEIFIKSDESHILLKGLSKALIF